MIWKLKCNTFKNTRKANRYFREKLSLFAFTCKHCQLFVILLLLRSLFTSKMHIYVCVHYQLILQIYRSSSILQFLRCMF